MASNEPAPQASGSQPVEDTDNINALQREDSNSSASDTKEIDEAASESPSPDGLAKTATSSIPQTPQTKPEPRQQSRPQLRQQHLSLPPTELPPLTSFSPLPPFPPPHPRTRRIRGILPNSDIPLFPAGQANPNRQTSPRNQSTASTQLLPFHLPTVLPSMLDLPPIQPLGPMLNPLPLPPDTAPPRAKLAVQLKMNLEIEVMLKARVYGDVLLSVL